MIYQRDSIGAIAVWRWKCGDFNIAMRWQRQWGDRFGLSSFVFALRDARCRQLYAQSNWSSRIKFDISQIGRLLIAAKLALFAFDASLARVCRVCRESLRKSFLVEFAAIASNEPDNAPNASTKCAQFLIKFLLSSHPMTRRLSEAKNRRAASKSSVPYHTLVCLSLFVLTSINRLESFGFMSAPPLSLFKMRTCTSLCSVYLVLLQTSFLQNLHLYRFHSYRLHSYRLHTYRIHSYRIHSHGKSLTDFTRAALDHFRAERN